MSLIDDGLPLPPKDVGEWVLEKHERLRRYVDITRATRRKYVQGPSATSTYIDPFCGFGRCRIKDTALLVPGSPVVAFESARDGGLPFTALHIADLNSVAVTTCTARLANMGAQATAYVGRAEETARQIVANLNPHGLHFGFLDPYNLESLSFELIRHLSSLKRMDLLIHLSASDLTRNLDAYTAAESSPLDSLAPGWRNHVDRSQAPPAARASFVTYWMSLVQALGYEAPRGAELVTGSKNQRLYWLVFFSRHPKANEFWGKIRHISGQGDMLTGF